MSQDVENFYASLSSTESGEWARLDRPFSRIEFLSTLRLVEKYFPPQGSVIDVGGGPGRYAVELLRRGYRVTLFDLTEKHLQQAQDNLTALGLAADQLVQGDARDLSRFPSASFDAGLLMGPLYHLSNSADRAAALREFHRVLKPGATAIAAYLNGWGLLQTGMSDFPARYETPAFLRQMLDEGTLDIWYWSNPQRAQAEVQAAGFDVVSYAGAESFVGGAKPMAVKLAEENPTAYENIARFAAETCEMPPFRDVTNHLHIVVRTTP